MLFLDIRIVYLQNLLYQYKNPLINKFDMCSYAFYESLMMFIKNKIAFGKIFH